MNFEDQLSRDLHTLADQAELSFSSEDVRQSLESQRQRPLRILVATAVVAAILGIGYAASTISGSTNVEATADETTGTSPSTETTPDTASALQPGDPQATDEAPIVVNLLVREDDPVRLGQGATVLFSEELGRIEVGGPPELLIVEEPMLEGATCVATQHSIGCNQAGSTDSDLYVVNDDERHVVQLELVDGINVLIEDEGRAVISGLPASGATVTLETDQADAPRRYETQAVTGVAAFPIAANATSVSIRATGTDGGVLFEVERLQLPEPPEAICGLSAPSAIAVNGAADLDMSSFVRADGITVNQFHTDRTERVEVFWPVRPRPLYALDQQPGFFVFPEPTGPFQQSARQGFEMSILDPERNPVGIDLTVTTLIEEPTVGCRWIEIVVFDEQQTEVSRFAFDLTGGPEGWPLSDLTPRITSTENLEVLPTFAIQSCDAADQPNQSGTVSDPAAASTPAEAFDNFMNTDPAWTFIDSGWHEMFTPDAVAYGMPFDWVEGGPNSQTRMVSIVIVRQTGDGWQATEWSGSGC